MRRIALCFDYDNCLVTQEYIYPFTPQKVGDIKTNRSVLDINKALWAQIVKLCREHTDLEVITLVHFSARQCLITDALNSEANQTESYFLAMSKIFSHVTQMLNDLGLTVKVELNELLMADIYNDMAHGDTRRLGLTNIDYSLHGRGMVKFSHSYNTYQIDDSKVSFVLAHVHAIEVDAFYYYDDRYEILETIHKFFSNKKGSFLIPENVRIVLLHYDNGNFKQSNFSEIVGSGQRCSGYVKVLKQLDASVYPRTFSASIETSVESFYAAYCREMNMNVIEEAPAASLVAASDVELEDVAPPVSGNRCRLF